MATRLPWRRAARILVRLLLFLAALPLGYFLMAALLGAIPANAGWQEPARGVQLYVRTNGVHTWILMPKTNAIMDWRPYAPPAHLRDPRYGQGDHIAVGYGNREFYLNTPTWADLSPRTAFYAAFGGGPPLLHVEHEYRPQPTEDTRPLKVTPDQYRRLVAFIRPRFRLDARGRTLPVLGRGYNDWDMFYEAQGGYSFVFTCNEWTGRALRSAGVRTGLWTPLAQSIMWRLD
jgi:uncharacterized protein (TIGR02117 family)